MSLWVDEYRPSSLNDLDCHKETTKMLEQLSSSSDFPHLLVYGPSGGGKKTRITAILRSLFGPGAAKLKMEARQFTTASNKKLELAVVSSNYHVEMTPSDVGIYDRLVVQDIIKETAQTQQVDASARKPFKVVVIHEADCLTRDAQAGLRRTMEKYMANLRIILCCTSTSKIIDPIRSRCLLVRIPLPSSQETINVLKAIAKMNSYPVTDAVLTAIVDGSSRNLRKAILMLEASKANPSGSAIRTDWEAAVAQIAGSILTEQTPKALADIRSKLYSLIANCIPPELIIKQLAFELVTNMDDALKRQVIGFAAEAEHRMRLGSKAIFHLEAFVAKAMSVYGSYLMELGQF